MENVVCKAKKKMNKKGFTLVELLVCVAIMAVMALLIAQFIVSSTGAYRRIYSQTEIQSDCQDALNQISNIVRNSKSLAITKYSSDGSITMESENHEGKKILLKYVYGDEGSGCIYVDYDYQATVDAANVGKDPNLDEIFYPDIASTADGEEYNKYLLTDTVKGFEVNFDKYTVQSVVGEGTVLSEAAQERTLDMALTLSKNNKEFTQNYKASIRNTASKITIKNV